MCEWPESKKQSAPTNDYRHEKNNETNPEWKTKYTEDTSAMKLLDRIDANDTKLKTPNGFDSISRIKVLLAHASSSE